jgi:isopenicillin N synthase-like dioxygenase
MFEIAKKKGYIRSWEGKVNDKTPYSFSETAILTNHYFHKPSDYKWSDLSAAWFALDPMDKTTKVRTFNNRKAVLANAILKEADLIDNDPSYRKKYRFDGELTNPMAYKEYTKAMREYAQMIANLNGFNESLLPLATTLGTNPRALYS